MSKARELRESSDCQINLYDLLSILVPEKKSKYVETILRIMKNTPNANQHVDEIKYHFEVNFGINKEQFNGFTNLQMIMIYQIINNLFNESDLQKFQKFCEYNERNLIPENDLTTYKSFEQISNSVSIADLIVEEKEMEKQIKILFKDNEWICLRPLTASSSRKYGANTKWCTAMEKDDTHFKKYGGNGVLIYSINKKNGYKVATYYSLKKESPEFSFWNAKDDRIDSLETELPTTLLKLILEEKRTNKSNLDLFNETKLENKKTIGGGILSSLTKNTNRISQAFLRENEVSEPSLTMDNMDNMEEYFLTPVRNETEPVDYSNPYAWDSVTTTDIANVSSQERQEMINRVLNR